MLTFTFNNKVVIFYLVCLSVIFSGCFRTYRETNKLCEGSLYLEIYDRYPDCRDYYLTDSTNFRTFFLARDLEHERFVYECKKDSVYLSVIENGSKNCHEYFDEAGRKGF